MQQAVPASPKGPSSPLGDQVYAALMEAIADRRFRPGERLMLDDLAAQMGVSRTPIRDALARLSAEGLVQPTGRRGFRVTPLTEEDLTDLYRLRLMCELYAVEEGIGNVTPELIAAMEEHAAECVRWSASPSPGGHLLVMAHDRGIHRLIVGLSGSRRLAELFERLSIHQQTYRAGAFLLIPPAQLQAAYRGEHGAIIEALRKGSAGEAKVRIRSHVEGGLARSLQHLRSWQPANTVGRGAGLPVFPSEEVNSA